MSSYWRPGTALQVSLFPGGGARAWLDDNRSSGAQLNTLLARRLPERLAQAWSAETRPVAPAKVLPASGTRRPGAGAGNWTLQPAGTEGYTTAEVTVGGIDTRDLHSKTMEARAVPGLHFIGEAVDVTGWLGGYNFQWAWASGHACGVAI